MAKKRDKRSLKNSSPTRIVFAGMTATAIFSILALAVSAVLITNGMLYEEMSKEIAMASVFIGVFIGSTTTAKINKSNSLATVVSAGLCFLVLRSVSCLCAIDGAVLNDMGIGVLFCTCCGTLAGALIGSREKRRKK